MTKCEFNSGEPCHPIACLARAAAASSAEDMEFSKWRSEQKAEELTHPLDLTYCEFHTNIGTILSTVRNCALNKVMALGTIHYVQKSKDAR
jgi:hypothetical protein